MRYETREKLIDATLIAVPCFLVLFFVVVIVAAYQASVDRTEWLNTNCKIIGKTGYQCNDGKIYWE